MSFAFVEKIFECKIVYAGVFGVDGETAHDQVYVDEVEGIPVPYVNHAH